MLVLTVLIISVILAFLIHIIDIKVNLAEINLKISIIQSVKLFNTLINWFVRQHECKLFLLHFNLVLINLKVVLAKAHKENPELTDVLALFEEVEPDFFMAISFAKKYTMTKK